MRSTLIIFLLSITLPTVSWGDGGSCREVLDPAQVKSVLNPDWSGEVVKQLDDRVMGALYYNNSNRFYNRLSGDRQTGFLVGRALNHGDDRSVAHRVASAPLVGTGSGNFALALYIGAAATSMDLHGLRRKLENARYYSPSSGGDVELAFLIAVALSDDTAANVARRVQWASQGNREVAYHVGYGVLGGDPNVILRRVRAVGSRTMFRHGNDRLALLIAAAFLP